nr:hypothetical protein [Actinomycetota bacterium]
MHALLVNSSSELVQQHIDDLRRSGAQGRLVRRLRSSQARGDDLRKAPAVRLQRVGAH